MTLYKIGSSSKKSQLLQTTEQSEVNKPTVVLFSWLGAKQKTAEKYVNCWTSRGHDVLLVKAPVKDLLCHKTGSNVSFFYGCVLQLMF